MKRMLLSSEHKTDGLIYKRLIIYGMLVLLGVLVPRVTVYGGLSPFGVSVAACTAGYGMLPTALSTAIGYLLAPQALMPLRYIAAVIAVGGFCWAFHGVRRITEHPLFSPLLASAATLVTGVALNSMNGFQWSVMISELCESLLAGGFAYFFKQALVIVRSEQGVRSLDFTQQSSLVITLAVLLMSLNTIVFGTISVGRILTMTVIVLASKAGGQYSGTLVGVVMGAATTLSMPPYAYLASSYAFGGLMTGLFARFGRPVAAMTFVLVNALVSFGFGESDIVITALYEVLAGAALYLLIPPSAERAVNALFSRAQTIPAVEGLRRSVDMRLNYAADTMEEIAKTVDSVSEKLSAMNTPSMREVYAAVCEGLCSGCYQQDRCWRTEHADTLKVFKRMGAVLQEKGCLETADLEERFSSRCHHRDEVLFRMNRGYGRMKVKESAYRRLADIRSIVTDQFQGMSSLLSELSEDFCSLERADPQTAERVEEICERYRVPVSEVVCMLGKRNRVIVEMLTEDGYVPQTDGRFFKELCDASGCELGEPTVIKSGEQVKVRFTEKPRLSVHIGSAQLNCEREKLCGDAFESFFDYEGRYCAVLCDGMGTGGRAAVDGAMTAALAGRMLQAGFRYESILRIINSALIIKSGDESLSTLDAVQIDLFTGAVRGLKAGAAFSFLYSRGRVTRIGDSSLPIGILREVEAQTYEEHLEAGDHLILVSDGVAEGETTWLETLIAQLVKEGTSEEAMANEIVFRARERCESGHGDDTTALVLRIA